MKTSDSFHHRLLVNYTFLFSGFTPTIDIEPLKAALDSKTAFLYPIQFSFYPLRTSPFVDRQYHYDVITQISGASVYPDTANKAAGTGQHPHHHKSLRISFLDSVVYGYMTVRDREDFPCAAGMIRTRGEYSGLRRRICIDLYRGSGGRY